METDPTNHETNMTHLPSWFHLTPGFTWFDGDGQISILLGWEPECQVTGDRGVITSRIDGESMVFVDIGHKPQMTYVTWNKNSWIVRDFDEANFDDASPMPEGHAILNRLMTRDTTKYMSRYST
jgi:hypothetical protein